jgi:hypothetical protein
MEFLNKVVVVTGGANGIGKAICDQFRKQGAKVCIIDKEKNDYFTGDIADENILKKFAEKVVADNGKIDCLINNAMLGKGGLENCSYNDFNYVRDAFRYGIKDFIIKNEIDKNLIESLSEVFLHMIRNSIDHGIETPEERRAAGKSEWSKGLFHFFQGPGAPPGFQYRDQWSS